VGWCRICGLGFGGGEGRSRKLRVLSKKRHLLKFFFFEELKGL